MTRKIPFLFAAALLLVGAASGAATPPAVSLDGSAGAPTLKGSTAAASANRAQAVATPPVDVKAAADADIARRNTQRPKLKATRQNLKEDDAAHVIQQQQNPSTYDRSIQMGDKDHTEQVTNLKVYIKK